VVAIPPKYELLLKLQAMITRLLMTLLERAIHRFLPRVGKAMRVMQTLMFRRAQSQIIHTGRPMDAKGHPIPWITYPALDYLSQLDFSRACVLKYGGGQSSLWWAKRAESVSTVEEGAEWAEKLRRPAPDNLTVMGPVAESAQASLPFLVEGGLLVLDNADWYPRICARLRSPGMVEIDFHGFGPVDDYTWCSSVFIRATIMLPHLGSPWPASVYGSFEQEF
jgi:hypothetical protein